MTTTPTGCLDQSVTWSNISQKVTRKNSSCTHVLQLRCLFLLEPTVQPKGNKKGGGGVYIGSAQTEAFQGEGLSRKSTYGKVTLQISWWRQKRLKKCLKGINCSPWRHFHECTVKKLSLSEYRSLHRSEKATWNKKSAPRIMSFFPNAAVSQLI